MTSETRGETSIPDRPGGARDAGGRDGRRLPGSLSVLIAVRSAFWERLLREVLDAEDWTITTTQNGVEATDRASEDAYDLALLDGKLPIKDGFEAAAEIREESEEAGIVLLVSEDDRETLEAARSSEADELLVRPFRESALRAACRDALRS